MAPIQNECRLDALVPGSRSLEVDLPPGGVLPCGRLSGAGDTKTRISKVKTLRVAIVSDVWVERNGVGTYYADLVEHLKDRVEKIEHFCPSSCPSRVVAQMPGDATQKITFPDLKTLRDRLAAFAPHIVIIPTPGPWGFFGARFALRHGLPIIVGYHTQFKGLTDLYWSGLRGRLSGFLMGFAHRWLFRRGDVVLITSPAMAQEARALGARAVDLMGTPLSPTFIGRPLQPLAQKITTVLFAGRLAPEKNLESVIEAARRLPGLRFMIAGDGPMRAQIEACARSMPNLQMLGWLPRAKVLDLLDTIDLIVLPSHVESLGSIALEGLARGRKVLVSKNCGITKWPMLDHALFRIEQSEILAQAIHRLADGNNMLQHKKAMSGPQGAIQMSEWAIDNWLNTLANHVTLKHA